MVDSKNAPSGILLAIGRRRHEKSLSEKSSCSRSRFSLWSSNDSVAGNLSVAGSSTSSSSGEDELDAPSEFVVECKHGERLFVTSFQGAMINARCRYFHSELLSCSNRVIKKSNWDIGMLRHVVELLSTGSTSIPNDETFFIQLLSIADEIGVDIRLTSLINQYDILNKVSTDRFFPMIDADYLQFNIRAAVASSQWMTLIKKGILLLLQPKMLVVKFIPNGDSTILTGGNEMGPQLQRLNACDGLCSEFSVYAKGKVKTLITIMDILSTLSLEQKAIQLRKPEIYKLVFKTRCGVESREQLELIMRMSTASYMKSNCVEEQYLKAIRIAGQSLNTTDNPQTSESRAIVVAIEQKQKIPEADGGESNVLSIATSKSDNKSQKRGFEYRTLSGQSFVVLKNLFEVLNSPCYDETNDEDNDRKEDLPACLMVTNPTPDTLGRFINSAHNVSGDCSSRVGFDLDDNCFFVSSTVSDISRMLDHLADYSSTAVVNHYFELYERQKER